MTYKDTPQGKTLGLDKYPLTDLKAIVNDLNDRSNPLSIKIAGLVVLNGQKFFSDKSIAGIPWSKLTQEQQDAALTAYYSLGEHAVSVDMSKNEFFPFTTGPKGGKVGPWILFGGDYAKLNAILAKARSVGLPAPPVTRVKAGPKAPAVPKHQASVNGLPVSVRSMIENSPAYANASLRRGMAQPLGEKISRAMAPGGSPAASGPQLGPEYLSQMQKHGGKYTALAHGQPGSLIPELRLAQKHVKSIAHLAAGKASAAPVLSKFLVSRRDALPSIALAGRQTAAKISTEQLISHHSDPALPNGSRHSAPDLQAAQKIDSLKLRGALEELLGQQARLPPSGATAFDPRVSPAWPGMQLPA